MINLFKFLFGSTESSENLRPHDSKQRFGEDEKHR